MAAGLIDRLFLAHPRSAGQGYFEHMRFAWSFAATMAVGTVAALVHGLYPFVCQTVRAIEFARCTPDSPDASQTRGLGRHAARLAYREEQLPIFASLLNGGLIQRDHHVQDVQRLEPARDVLRAPARLHDVIRSHSAMSAHASLRVFHRRLSR